MKTVDISVERIDNALHQNVNLLKETQVAKFVMTWRSILKKMTTNKVWMVVEDLSNAFSTYSVLSVWCKGVMKSLAITVIITEILHLLAVVTKIEYVCLIHISMK